MKRVLCNPTVITQSFLFILLVILWCFLARDGAQFFVCSALNFIYVLLPILIFIIALFLLFSFFLIKSSFSLDETSRSYIASFKAIKGKHKAIIAVIILIGLILLVLCGKYAQNLNNDEKMQSIENALVQSIDIERISGIAETPYAQYTDEMLNKTTGARPTTDKLSCYTKRAFLFNEKLDVKLNQSANDNAAQLSLQLLVAEGFPNRLNNYLYTNTIKDFKNGIIYETDTEDWRTSTTDDNIICTTFCSARGGDGPKDVYLNEYFLILSKDNKILAVDLVDYSFSVYWDAQNLEEYYLNLFRSEDNSAK